MEKKRFRFYQVITPVLGLGVVIFLIVLFISENKSRREELEGVWLLNQPDQTLLTFSSMSSGKGYSKTYYIRLINTETGKILQSNSISFKYNQSTQLKCCTSTSLWLKSDDQYTCFDFPSLKKRWSHKAFFEKIKKDHPEFGEPFSCKLLTDHFQITNKEGKDFILGVEEFEKPMSEIIFFFDEITEMGKRTYYPTPETKFIKSEVATMEVETVGEKKEYQWATMNIHEKLLADTGYARNYAVFSPDSIGYFFDGDHSRILKKLVNDSLELIWNPVLKDRAWLEGDFLRPYKEYNRLPVDRLITTNDTYAAFIHYGTSLDKKDNKLKLAAFDLKTEKILWDIDLTSSNIVDGYQPEQTMVIGNTLVIVWKNAEHAGILMGIDGKTGEVKWKVRK